jgi:hypothetical protein
MITVPGFQGCPRRHCSGKPGNVEWLGCAMCCIQTGDQLLEGHGTRGGKAMIATLRRALILTPARLVSHGGQLIMRLAPGADLLPAILATIRALPAPAG